jgi:hypothetical protein
MFQLLLIRFFWASLQIWRGHEDEGLTHPTRPTHFSIPIFYARVTREKQENVSNASEVSGAIIPSWPPTPFSDG